MPETSNVVSHEGAVRPEQRIVVKIPIKELWDERGPISGLRISELDPGSIRLLLKSGLVKFVVADVGLPLQWIEPDDRFDFWKAAGLNVAVPEQEIPLEHFPNNLAYFASQWAGRDGECIVLLEKHH
jgi:hypothetical protein